MTIEGEECNRQKKNDIVIAVNFRRNDNSSLERTTIDYLVSMQKCKAL